MSLTRSILFVVNQKRKMENTVGAAQFFFEMLVTSGESSEDEFLDLEQENEQIYCKLPWHNFLVIVYQYVFEICGPK